MDRLLDLKLLQYMHAELPGRITSSAFACHSGCIEFVWNIKKCEGTIVNAVFHFFVPHVRSTVRGARGSNFMGLISLTGVLSR